MRFVSALRLRVSAFKGKPWPIVEEKNKLRNQQKKNQEEQAKEKADWNCEKSGNFKNFITNGNVSFQCQGLCMTKSSSEMLHSLFRKSFTLSLSNSLSTIDKD